MNRGFTEGGKATLEFARLIAGELGHTYIGSEHLLLALLSDSETSDTKRIFGYFKVNYADILQRTVNLFGKGDKTSPGIEDMTPTMVKIIEKSRVIAKKYSNGQPDSGHLAIALLGYSDSVGAKLVEQTGAKRAKVQNLFLSSIENEKKLTVFSSPVTSERRDSLTESEKLTPQLNKYGHDLVKMAYEGKCAEVIGREYECERVIRTLMRKGKNNPCLIGEPGVGKTAIAEGIAKMIVEGKVPETLLCYRIISLDISSVVAGAKYRGDFEERIRDIIREVVKAGNVILFIDEIHNIVGAGSAEGAVDAANILKPALARDEVKIIGATTLREYKKYIEKDSALERRFQPILVNEPTRSEALEILFGIRKNYEEYHGVKITDEALRASVELSERFITDRFLPDKAIDLMDEAASRKKIARGKSVNESDIALSLSEILGIPYGKVSGEEIEEMTTLADTLKASVIGQDEAVEALTQAYFRSRFDISESSRPRGAYAFAGPTGVGKTELARIFAETVFGKDGFIRIDMSEFSERHSVSKLIGSPPGYVGYDESFSKLEKLRRHPYSVVLFDEVEKAHKEVINLLLQILDSGTLTDSHGRITSFKNAVVILTSNVGVHSNKLVSAGFGEQGRERDTKSRVMENLRKILSPEIVSRLDEVILFSRLDRNHLERISRLCIDEFTARCQNKGIEIEVEEGVAECIASKSEVEAGGRGIRNEVKKQIENRVSKLLLSSGENSKIKLTSQNGTIDAVVLQTK